MQKQGDQELLRDKPGAKYSDNDATYQARVVQPQRTKTFDGDFHQESFH